jgi:hypothetical protein
MKSKYPMSDTFLKLIPTNPEFIPAKTKQEQAKVLLSRLFKNRSIVLESTPEIQFVDQGANFEDVFCNYCGKEIKGEIWQDAMNEAYKNKFHNLSFITPCCHKKTNLNDLQYHRAAGFAKFQIVIMNPDSDMKDTNLTELEKILGTSIRKVWTHY